MSRYIDADELQDFIFRYGDHATVDDCIKWIEQTETADVVEAVRCKDCKHYKRNIPCVGGHYNGCDEWIDEGNPITVYDNDFCNYGERADT